MDVSATSIFLVGSILLSLAMLILVSAVVLINNIIHKYWKPVKIYAYHTVERQQPEVQEVNKKTTT
jgi:hypothetical protein